MRIRGPKARIRQQLMEAFLAEQPPEVQELIDRLAARIDPMHTYKQNFGPVSRREFVFALALKLAQREAAEA